jgi:hypothetical protein
VPTLFHCDATFTIPSRQYFVLAGQIVEGNVRPGMRIIVPTPTGAVFERPIDSVSLISTANSRGAVGLCIMCVDRDEVQALQRLCIMISIVLSPISTF